MRISVDIPDRLYQKLKFRAAREGRSVKDLILAALERNLQLRGKKPGRGVSFPLIRSKRPGTLHIDNAKIFELMPFL